VVTSLAGKTKTRTRAVHKRARGLRKRARGYRKRAMKAWRGMPKRRQRAARRVHRLLNRRYRHTYGYSLSRVPDRDEIPVVLNRRRLTGEGAEIGVKAGRFSDFLLSEWEGARLISIDPWLEAGTDDYLDRANVEQERHEQFYGETRERLAAHGPRSEIWRMTSLEAAAQVPDATLDFVYIDARHDYASVKDDLEAWFPKVRSGGIISGHDYADGRFAQGEFGVKRAVDEFFAARRLTVHATGGRPPVEMFASWMVEVR
jgi:hypothetical protein